MLSIPTISVILPVYNAGQYLAEAIESILSQSFSDFELIIINDGLTDKSLDIIRSFNDPRIVVIDQPNQGLAKTLNIGISNTKGVYIARMDQDDISLNDRFENQLQFLEKHKHISVISGAVEYINEKGETFSRSFPVTSVNAVKKSTLYFGSVLVHPAVMMRGEDLEKVGRYSETAGGRFADYHLWVKFLRKGYKLANQSKVVLKYRLLESSMSSEFSMTEESWKILRKIIQEDIPNEMDVAAAHKACNKEVNGTDFRAIKLGIGGHPIYQKIPKKLKPFADLIITSAYNFRVYFKRPNFITS